MPDISMCPGGDCPSKETCYRYTAEPSMWQSVADFNTRRKGDKCDNYWPNKEENKEK